LSKWTKSLTPAVMELLREHRVSQGKAAEILNLSRNEIFDLMTNYRVPVIDLDAEELGNELRKPLPRSYRRSR